MSCSHQSHKKIGLCLIAFLLALSIGINFTACGTAIYADDLMVGIDAGVVNGKQADDPFTAQEWALELKLFQASSQENQEKNLLISPLSIQLALAMTANGANGATLQEMETLLGGTIPLTQLNAYLYSYVHSLTANPDATVKIANSIWFRDDAQRMTVNHAFLQTNADYYGASAYKAPFNEKTIEDINNWVVQHTDGMISEIIDEIQPENVICLINALVFDATWENVYHKENIYEGVFHSLSGQEQTATIMASEETKYLIGENCVGFIKDYKGGAFSFAALLPDEGMDPDDLIQNLTPEMLQAIFANVQNKGLSVILPKFSYDFSLSMNSILCNLGMPTAFSNGADFSGISSNADMLHIDEVLHKTFIAVDELGTKAGAVTSVMMSEGAMEMLCLSFDRPFIYFILDNVTGLPIFIGTLTDIAS